MASGKTLRTPSLDLGILAGVTRQTLLELAGPCGYAVEEGAFALEDVLAADEVFTSSSASARSCPSSSTDDIALGAAAAVLQQALRDRRQGLTHDGDGAARGEWRSGTACSCTARPPGRLAVRDEDGALRVASGKKPRFAESVSTPFFPRPTPTRRGLRRPACRAAVLPQARMPFARPGVLGALALTMVGGRIIRRSATLSRGGRELVAAGLALLPAAVALREPGLAEYHGGDTSRSGHENGGERAPKEHPRCGSQLIGPLLASSLAANAAASTVPRPARGIARAGDDRRSRGGGGGVRVDEPPPRKPARPRARPAGVRAPAPILDRGAVAGAGRGRGRRTRRVPCARDVSPCRPGQE